jgi:hypothetical protein
MQQEILCHKDISANQVHAIARILDSSYQWVTPPSSKQEMIDPQRLHSAKYISGKTIS